MEPNFKCPKTGKLFVIGQYRTVAPGGVTAYRDMFMKPLINPDNGVELEYIGVFDGYPTTIHNSKQEKYDSMQKHFKKRAKNHANETKDQKRKVTEREVNNVKSQLK